MQQDQETILKRAFGRNPTRFEISSEDGEFPAWHAGPATPTDRTMFAAFEEAANKTVESLWRAAHDANVRLFVGTKFPLLINDRSDDAFLLYAIPNLNVCEIIELFEVGRSVSDELTWEQFQEMVVAKHPRFGGQSPLNRAMYNSIVFGEGHKRPWRRVRKAMGRIYDRHPFEITSVSPEHMTARLLEPVNEKAAKWCENIVLKVNADAANLDSPKTVWEQIAGEGLIKLWWD